MAYPDLDALKQWLRFTPSPSWEPTELDALLTGLLAAAIEQVEGFTGDLSTDTPERVSLAIKFLAGSWFENPIPDQRTIDATTNTVRLLIAAYADYSFATQTGIVIPQDIL